MRQLGSHMTENFQPLLGHFGHIGESSPIGIHTIFLVCHLFNLRLDHCVQHCYDFEALWEEVG